MTWKKKRTKSRRKAGRKAVAWFEEGQEGEGKAEKRTQHGLPLDMEGRKSGGEELERKGRGRT